MKRKNNIYLLGSHLLSLKNKITLLPGASIFTVVPETKFAGVIVTAFEPEVDLLMIIFTIILKSKTKNMFLC